MNRAVQATFDATPTELRAERRRTNRLVADGGLVLRLPYDGPLDWEAWLAWFRPRLVAGVEAIEHRTYRRTVMVDGDPGVIEVAPSSSEPALLVRAHLPHWDGVIHLVQRVRQLTGLDADPRRAVEALAADPLLAPLLTAHRGRRPPGCWDPFEMGVRAILGQQVSVASATTLTRRLVERVGTAVPGLVGMGLTRCFPSAAAVAAADLGGLGLTDARARTIGAFAAAVAAGDLPLDGIAPLDELERALCALPGIGPWTAQYLALRMGEPDAFPAGDLWLRRAVAAPGARALTTAALAQRAEAWRPHRAYAAMLLWASAVPAP